MTDLTEIPDKSLLLMYDQALSPKVGTFPIIYAPNGVAQGFTRFTPHAIIAEMERRTTPGTRFDISRFRMGLFPPHKT